MSRGNSWNNVPASITINIGYEPGIGWMDEDGTLFPYIVECQFPRPSNEDDAADVTIHFKSSGYYEPAHISRHAENDYPEEGDDERIAHKAVFDNGTKRTLSAAALSELEWMYSEEIYQEEIDYSANEPDWDSIAEARAEARAERLQARYDRLGEEV